MYHPPNNSPEMAEDTKQKGGLLIQDIWAKGTDFIFDMRVVNTDSVPCVLKTSDKILITVERDRKRKYFYACLQKHGYPPPFVVSCSVLNSTQWHNVK